MPAYDKYKQEYHDDWAWSLAIKGATNDDIAEAFGISVRTFIRWKQAHPSLEDAVMRGKDIADAKVEKSLYERAIGFDVEETEKIVTVDKDGNPAPARVRTIKKHVAPDTMACMYWLNNRRRGAWAQKQEVELSASSDNPQEVVIYMPKRKSEDECLVQPPEDTDTAEDGAVETEENG